VKPRPKANHHLLEFSFSKIIYRYLVKKFVGPFALTFFLALLIIDMQFLWKYVDDLVGKGLEWYLILQLLFYVSATFVSLALALAVLLSSLMAFGNLGEKYEIVALKSAGISVLSLMKPLAFIALFVGLFSFWFSDNVVPAAYVKWRSMMYEIVQQKPTLSIDEGVFYDGIDGYVIRIGKKHRDNENIEDVLIYDHTRHFGNLSGTYAHRGKMTISPDKKYFIFNLYDGFLWDEGRSQNSRNASYPYFFAHFDQQYMKMDISSFQMQDADESFFKDNSKSLKMNKIMDLVREKEQEMKDISEGVYMKYESNFFKEAMARDLSFDLPSSSGISYQWKNLPPEWKDQVAFRAVNKASNTIGCLPHVDILSDLRAREIRESMMEYHQRMVLPFACLLFFFIGAPLGTIIRKGGIGIPLVITVVFFAFYFVISIFGEKVAKSGEWPVWAGMWFSTFITIPICIFLTYKATNDSAILSPDTYTHFFAKVRLFFKKIFLKNKNENTPTLS
jgi:lipopolysaccharide export system permease protein